MATQSSLLYQKTLERVIYPRMVERFKRYPSGRKMIATWKEATDRLSYLGRLSYNNKVTIMRNSDEAFQEIWKTVETSKKKVLMEVYTIKMDQIGQRTMGALMAARKAGSDVYLVYDWLGSLNIKEKALSALRVMGGVAHAFNPLVAPGSRLRSMFHRNHRKLIAVDDKVAFLGGMNHSESYAGERVGGQNYFKDIQLKLEGPVASDLTKVAYDSIKELSGVDLSIPSVTPDSTPDDDGIMLQVLDNNLLLQRKEIREAFKTLLNAAQEYCYITTPYFLPPKYLKARIIRAARRGVDVRIITAGKTDVPLAHWASQHIYSSFLRAGVTIYEMHEEALHAKIFIVDGLYSSVGSFNLDLWSHRNLETNVGTFDYDVTCALEERFRSDLKKCRRITLKELRQRPWWLRVLHWLSYQFLWFMRPPPVQALLTAVKEVYAKQKRYLRRDETVI